MAATKDDLLAAASIRDAGRRTSGNLGPTPSERGYGIFGGRPGANASLDDIGSKIFPKDNNSMMSKMSQSGLFSIGAAIQDIEKRKQIQPLIDTQAVTGSFTGQDIVKDAYRGTIGGDFVGDIAEGVALSEAKEDRELMRKLKEEVLKASKSKRSKNEASELSLAMKKDDLKTTSSPEEAATAKKGRG